MTPSKASARLRRFQYGVVAQLSVIGMINYMDRATLSIANPLVRQDMGLSVSQMGLLLSAFPLTYALAQLPLGLVIDRLGSRLLLGLGLLVWSLAQCLGGLVGSASQLWACRFLLGIGEAPTLPSSTKVVRRWHAPHERGTPVGIFTGANHLGQAIAAPFLTLLMVGLGWRWMFIIMGLAGFVSAAVWFATYRDPANAGLAPADHAHLAEGETLRDVRQMTFALWRRLFTFRTSWGLFLGVFASSYMGNVYATWLPGYMEMEHHLSITQTGLIITIPYVCSVIGSVFAGWSSDYLVRRGISPLNSGRIPFVAGLVGMAGFTVLTALSAGWSRATFWLSCAMFFSQLSGSCSWIAASAAVPENCLGSFGGIQNCFGYLGGALAPALTRLRGPGHRLVHHTAADRRRDLDRGCRDLLTVPRGPITATDLTFAAGAPPPRYHERQEGACHVPLRSLPCLAGRTRLRRHARSVGRPERQARRPAGFKTAFMSGSCVAASRLGGPRPGT